MLSEMGFEYITKAMNSKEFWVYFHKKISERQDVKTSSQKVNVVIQSATPVAYPVIMRLLQSEKIRNALNITELKVWEETEKHLAWITSGKPFGRPEKIYKDFVTGKADTVILREPEASYAIKIMQDRGKEISVISYNKIWNEINKSLGSFPYAGLVLKGEFARKNPELTQIFLKEPKSAINWVNENKKAAAELSFDLMHQSVDRIELFLDRVNFDYKEGDELIYKVKQYFDILNKQGIVNLKIDDEFLEIFKLNNS